MEIVECINCGTIYSETEKICPQCGIEHRRIYISANASVGMSAKVEGMEGKNPHLSSKKKLRWRWVSKDTVQRGDRVTPVHHYQLIDKDNDLYEEVVTNLRTGEIIHECEEPLSEHRGHGSDKKETHKKGIDFYIGK